MNKAKKILQKLLILGVIIVGLYMLFSYAWPSPPAVSGLGFLFAGLAMWIPHCPICKAIFGK